MPFTPNDFEQMFEQLRKVLREETVRAARDEADRRLLPVTKRLAAHSGEMKAVRELREEFAPDVLRKMEQSNHDQDQATASLAKITEQALIAIREDQAAIRQEQVRSRDVQAEHGVILMSLTPVVDNTEKAALVTQGTAKATHLEAKDAAMEARNAGIDLKLLKKDAAKTVAWWRHPAVAVIIGAVVSALLNHFDPPAAPVCPQGQVQRSP